MDLDDCGNCLCHTSWTVRRGKHGFYVSLFAVHPYFPISAAGGRDRLLRRYGRLICIAAVTAAFARRVVAPLVAAEVHQKR